MINKQHKSAFVLLTALLCIASVRAQVINLTGSTVFYATQGQILSATDGFSLVDTATIILHQSQVLSAGDVVMGDATNEYQVYGVAASATATFYSAVPTGLAGFSVVNTSGGTSAFSLKLEESASLGSGALPVIWQASQTTGSGVGNLVFTWDASVEPSVLSNKQLYVYSSGQWTALPAANTTVGSYTLTYAGFSGSLSATRFAIASGLSISLTPTNPSCYGGTGSISATASGGIGTKTYKLDSGSYQAGSTFSSLSAGTYTVTVKDQGGNEQSAMATLTQPTQITGSASVTESSGTSNDGTICAGASAGISVSASGGTGMLGYAWNNSVGSGPHSVSPATSTTYTVTVTDANSCTLTASVTVTVSSPSASVSGVTTICPGGSTTLTASGGGTYVWSNSLGTNAAVSLSPASTTAYTVTVTAADGCTDSETATVTVATATASISGTTSVCTGGSTTLTASGAGAGMYAWSNSLGSNAGITVSPTTSTTYTVTVTNASGCTDSESATVTVNSLPTAAIGGTTSICNGSSTTLTASGAGTYAWSNSLGTNAGITVSPATNTTYTVTVTDINGCTDSETASITVNSLPTAAIGGTTTICTGGSTTLTASGAGAGTYAWANSLGSNTGITVSPTTNTIYTVTVTDINGCTDSETASVTVNSLPSAAIGGTTTICSGGSTTLTASGAGAGTYAWSNSLGSNAGIMVSPTTTTSYTVTVTDANGCTDSETVNVTVNSLPTAAIGGTTAICTGGSTTLTASGAGTYAWSNSLGSNAGITVSPTTNTSYTVTVTDANGCTDSETANVTVNSLPTAAIGGTTTICTGGSTTLTASGAGTGTYAWANSLGSNAGITVSPTSGTTYTVTITDANGCTDSETASVTVNSLPTASISGATQICSGSSTTLTASGGSTYGWSSSLGVNAAVSVSPTSNTTYTVTVTDINGCTDTESFSLAVDLPSAAISGNTMTCVGGNTVLTASGGVSYSWSNSLGTNAVVTVTPSGNTTYTVTVTNASNCTASASVNVTVGSPPSPVLTVTETSGSTNDDAIICAGASAVIQVSGGVSFLWSDGSTNSSLNILPACTSTYDVTVTDPSNCTATASSTIVVNYPPAITGMNPLTGTAGTMITITGTSFSDVTEVRFNNVPGTNLLLVNAGEIRANLPVSGSVQTLSIISPCGTATLPVIQPSVTSFTPASGPIGTVVSITGNQLDQVNSIIIGGTQAAILSKSTGTATAVVMPGATTGAVTVSTGAGSGSATGNFTVTGTQHPYIQQGNRLASASPNAQQGTSVASSADGNTVVVGGPADNSNAGAAWVYYRTGTTWTQSGIKLVGSGAIGASKQGTSVAISHDGKTVVVGGPADDNNNGAAWVYTRSGNTWSQLGSKLVGTGAAGAAQQGISVAISGDGKTVAVGGIADDLYAGATWVFSRYENQFLQIGSKVTGAGGIGKSRQGAALALDATGNTLAVGGYQDNNRQGAVWIFSRNDCEWNNTGGKLAGTGGSVQAWQGYAVSLSADGNTLISGGPSDNSLLGAAWIFTRSGASWNQQDRLVGASSAGAARQGSAVSTSADGKTALVGGFGDNSNKGAMWVYKYSNSSWSLQGAKLTGNGANGSAKQGTSVGLSANGNTAFIGGPSDAVNKGAVWVYVPSTLQTFKDAVDDRRDEPTISSGEFHLDQNIPNPFSDQTTFTFALTKPCKAIWEITDANGRLAVRLERDYPAGELQETFSLNNISGVYLCRLITPEGIKTRKMVVQQK
jgi:predicted transcriptional regulator